MARQVTRVFDERQILVSRLKRTFLYLNINVDWDQIEETYSLVKNGPKETKADLQNKIARLEAMLEQARAS